MPAVADTGAVAGRARGDDCCVAGGVDGRTAIVVVADVFLGSDQLASASEIDVDKYLEYIQSTFDQALEAIGISYNEIMGIRHKKLPIEGVQFHPESILTKSGKDMLANFLKLKIS